MYSLNYNLIEIIDNVYCLFAFCTFHFNHSIKPVGCIVIVFNLLNKTTNAEDLPSNLKGQPFSKILQLIQAIACISIHSSSPINLHFNKHDTVNNVNGKKSTPGRLHIYNFTKHDSTNPSIKQCG